METLRKLYIMYNKIFDININSEEEKLQIIILIHFYLKIEFIRKYII